MNTQHQWIVFYKTLARKLLDFESNPARLFGLFQYMAVSILRHSTPEWTATEPFSFFAALAPYRSGRGADSEALYRLLRELGLGVPVPDHFRGCAVLDGPTRWFLPKSAAQDPRDLPHLWRLARAAIVGGRAAVDPAWIDECLTIKGVTLAKLSTALSWLNPGEFLPLNDATCAFLASRGYDAERHQIDGAAYKNFIEEVQISFGDDLVALVERAQSPPQHNNVGHARSSTKKSAKAHPESVVRTGARRYFAGGYQWEDRPMLFEFIRGRYWQVGFGLSTTEPAGLRCWSRFEEIRCGDRFAIKGIPMPDRLITHVVGIVTDIEPLTGRIQLVPVDVPVYNGPLLPTGSADASWFQSLLELKDAGTITQIFGKLGIANSPTKEAERAPS